MTDFDKIFEIVGCNRLAKDLLNAGYDVEKVRELYNKL